MKNWKSSTPLPPPHIRSQVPSWCSVCMGIWEVARLLALCTKSRRGKGVCIDKCADTSIGERTRIFRFRQHTHAMSLRRRLRANGAGCSER